MRARVGVVCGQMINFDSYLGVQLIHTILQHTGNLSKTLQLTKLSAAEGQHLAKKLAGKGIRMFTIVHNNNNNLRL